MATWPAYGEMLLEDFGETPESAVLRSEMESGPAKQRQVRTLQQVTRQAHVIFTAAEMASFKTFYRTDIHRGTDWFLWTDPADGVEKNARIVNGEIEAKAQMKLPGEALSWRVSFLLETLE